MIELRDMQLLVALARHRHFARAARDVGISQPAFSMRIRKLESTLGITVVTRGNRFEGFTEQGEALVLRARGILAEAKAMEDEARAAKGVVSGLLVLGVVPTALAWAARLCLRMRDAFPDIVMRIESATSLAIQQGVDDGSFAAGITYGDGVSPDLYAVIPLYEESYALLAPVALAPRRTGTATWAEAAALPLSLLEPQMQNRRTLDRTFDEAGLRPDVIAETNVFTPSIILAHEGHAATILPEVLLDALGDFPGTCVLPLTEPRVGKSICLVSANRAPVSATVEALKRVAQQ
jgi:DNA-binding transcriptional LysR family regulator